MTYHRTGDIFDQPDVNVILHNCNLHHVWGAGIVVPMKAKYPEAFEADLRTPKDDPSKLGTFSRATGQDGRIIINIYAMPRLGAFSYDAFLSALTSVKNGLHNFNKRNCQSKEKILGIPYGIGCGLAGGCWTATEALIRKVFDVSEDYPVTCVICKRPQDPILN